MQKLLWLCSWRPKHVNDCFWRCFTQVLQFWLQAATTWAKIAFSLTVHLIPEHSGQRETAARIWHPPARNQQRSYGLTALLLCPSALMSTAPGSSARLVLEKKGGCDLAGVQSPLLWEGRKVRLALRAQGELGRGQRQLQDVAGTAASCGLLVCRSRKPGFPGLSPKWAASVGDFPSCLLCQGMAGFPCSSVRRDLLPALESIRYNSEPFLG